MMNQEIENAANLLKQSKHTIVLTGAGISVESGIPPFRGADGIWTQYDPITLDLDYFLQNPEISWPVLKKLFYDPYGQAKPNEAHYALARLEKQGIIKTIITQNIDNLHQQAGSQNVYEFHGALQSLKCLKCDTQYKREEVDFKPTVPRCQKDNGLLKPNFVFFSEGIPPLVATQSFAEALKANVVLVIGTTGEVMPACAIPYEAQTHGAKVIEINPNKSNYTDVITDVFLNGKATEMMTALERCLVDV
ncbi:MAG: RNA polymerase subunit sigma [Candidatus Parabeggiatoa sp. nov. 1]|nr:MAG: RNA polymerase subunit sigma [Gammaproteobacteria bacterium]